MSVTVHQSHTEPSFRDSVDLMFAQAAALIEMPEGLEEKIRVCNSTYTVRFGVKLRGRIFTFTGWPTSSTSLGCLTRAQLS